MRSPLRLKADEIEYFSARPRENGATWCVTEQEIVETLSNPVLTRPGNQPDRTIYERNIGKIVCVVTVDQTNPLVIVSAWKKN